MNNNTLTGLFLMSRDDACKTLDAIRADNYHLHDFERGHEGILTFSIEYFSFDCSIIITCDINRADGTWVGTLYGMKTINAFLHDCFLARK